MSHNDAIDERDLATLGQLRDLYAHVDPVPAGLGERLKFAITVQALHAEIAELTESALLATRGSGTHVEPTRIESVTFSAPSVGLMVSVGQSEGHEDLVRIDGWVTRPGAAVEAVMQDRAVTANSDANGRFVVHDLPHGPIHFVIRVDPSDPRTRPVITPTIEV
ncbi:carboxypeptidase regulatory-like domain-containing protein [Intrasporangium sp.]|uniref:carboxypeptidase regulatory-like domain-containing protein n=1 Tax=Intrasporangium sp. TaxID=1925024 RepID=UPI003221CF37